MGKGDRKSKKGKLWRKSYGNLRNRKAMKARANQAVSKKVAKTESTPKTSKPKKTARKKAES